MEVFRFMSIEEFEKYRNGSILINNTKHIGRTNSTGFCFFNLKDFKPEEAMHFLSGIVSFDICAVFETNEKLEKTYGGYKNPFNNTELNIFIADEYCITEYDNKRFKLLKYSENIWRQWDILEKQKELKWKEKTI